MLGILCCFGQSPLDETQNGQGTSGASDPAHGPRDFFTLIAPLQSATKQQYAYNGLQPAYNGHAPANQPTVRSPMVGPYQPDVTVLSAGPEGDISLGVVQGIDVQRKLMLLQGPWWTRVEGALELIAKTYSAACASVWIMDESTDSFVAMISKGPMRQAVQPGCVQQLASEYDADAPSSLTRMWETQTAQIYSVNGQADDGKSAPQDQAKPFFADWKQLHNAHQFTDFVAMPILAAPLPAAVERPVEVSAQGDSAVSAGVLMSTLGCTTSNASNVVAPAAAASATGNVSEGGSGQQLVGALTLYFSRPDQDPGLLPTICCTPLEQMIVALALAGVLYSSGTEPVRQICDLVLAIQSAAGSGELAAAVASGLQARLQYAFAVSPAALLALVPPRQVSAVVFRDQTAVEGAAGAGALESMAGCSSSQTLPLLHPALASVAGGGGGGGTTAAAAANGAGAPYSGSHSHGGGTGVRVQFRAAGIQLGHTDGGGAGGSIERSPSLLGTGLRGEAAAAAAAAAAAGGTGGGAPTAPNYLTAEGGTGAAAAAAAAAAGMPRLVMPPSRSTGVLAGHTPSGLLSCKLDRMTSRHKALVFPLSHTLLQVVLQQRQQEKKAKQGRAGAGVHVSGPRHISALRDLCANASAFVATPSGAARGGGWIISDCNEHLHAVHSPSRDIYVLARVNGRRPHSLILATAELTGLAGIAAGGDGGGGGGGGADGGGGGGADGGGGGSNATHIALYMAFPERLPRQLLELVLADMQLLMRRLLAPLIRHRFETSLAEEWSALAGAANNLPCPGGPALRIPSSVSASQARHVPGPPPPPPGPRPLSGSGSPFGEVSPTSATAATSTPPIPETQSNPWLSRLGGGGGGEETGAGGEAGGPATSSQLMQQRGSGGGGGTGPGRGGGVTSTASELHLEGLSAGEALQQMSVLVSSYMDTLQAVQGQLMASDRLAESLRREDLPHLQLLEVLGHGGGGVVFRGKLHALEVAVKVFEVPGDLATAAGLPINSAGGAAAAEGFAAAAEGGGGGSTGGANAASAWPAVSDRRVLQRSALELAVTCSLSHPHIIQVYSLYTNMVLVKQKPPRQGTSGVQLLELSAATAFCRAEEGIPCAALCMEYCDMGTLAHAIDQQRFMALTPLGARRPSLKAICTCLLEVALALRHLHARNLAHCDLKPANVLLKSSRRDNRGFTCKLADFGYVSVLKATVPGGRPTILPEEACGTVTHMAPETFIKGQPLDFSVDTFSFGILMWELYTCARPYSDVPEDQIAQRVTLRGLRPTFPPDTPRSYGALARHCWSQDPNDRPSASDIVAAIENMLALMSSQLPAIPPMKPKQAVNQPAAATAAAAAAPAAAPAVAAAATTATAAATAGSPYDRSNAGSSAAALAAGWMLPYASPGGLVEKPPPPAMTRGRGSQNGGVVPSPLGQSPLGRVPGSPPASPRSKARRPKVSGPAPAGSQPAAEAS